MGWVGLGWDGGRVGRPGKSLSARSAKELGQPWHPEGCCAWGPRSMCMRPSSCCCCARCAASRRLTWLEGSVVGDGVGVMGVHPQHAGAQRNIPIQAALAAALMQATTGCTLLLKNALAAALLRQGLSKAASHTTPAGRSPAALVWGLRAPALRFKSCLATCAPVPIGWPDNSAQVQRRFPCTPA